MSEKIFFIYGHLRADLELKGRVVIHRSDCLWCRNGQGIHRRRGGIYGQWYGPFETYEEAYMFADKLLRFSPGRKPIKCSHCFPTKPFSLKRHVEEGKQLKKVKSLK